MGKREADLLVDHRVVFLVNVAALGMAEDDDLDAEVLELEDGNFAGVGALLVGAHVLGSEENVGSLDDLRNRVERGEGRAIMYLFGPPLSSLTSSVARATASEVVL